MEVANRYQHRRQTMDQGKTSTAAPQLSQQQMRAMIDRVKSDPRFNGTLPRKKGQGAKK